MTISAGTRLGSYEILAPLGAGGMGEVYRARDPKLGREVAIKVLPGHVASDPEALARFEREARAVASLSHPNIMAIFDFGTQDGVLYAVTELLEGETLAARLARGSLPTEQLVRVGAEICAALTAAHRKGIVHRDLKPANVMLTKSGVKLLDFGLAKSVSPDPAHDGLTVAPTAAPDLTAEGAIVGTLSYMSPEQLEGKPVDARTDIFALGSTLYEMATGKKAFERENNASVISAILASEPPPVSAIRPMSPPMLDRLVRICLAKDPDARWQTAHDVGLPLQAISDRSPLSFAGAGNAPRRTGAGWLPWAIAAVFAALAVLALVRSGVSRVPTSRPVWFALPPERPGVSLHLRRDDGRDLARRVPDRLCHFPVRGFRRAAGDRRAGFPGRAGNLDPGPLRARGAPGPGHGERQFALLVPRRPVARLLHARKVEADRPFGKRGCTDLRRPRGGRQVGNVGLGRRHRVRQHPGSKALPGRRGGRCADGRDRSGSLAGRDAPQLAVVPAGRKAVSLQRPAAEQRREPDAGGAGKGAARDRADELGRSVFRAGISRLFAGRSASRTAVRRQARAIGRRPVLDRRACGLLPLERAGFLRRLALGDARLPASPGREPPRLDRPRRAVERDDRAPRQLSERRHRGGWAPDLLRSNTAGSRDLRRLVFRSREGRRNAGHDRPRYRIRPRGVEGRKGDRLFVEPRRRRAQLVRRNLETGREEQLPEVARAFQQAQDVSPDGRNLVYVERGAGGNFDIWTLPIPGPGRPTALLQSSFDKKEVRFSPDGRFLAFISSESGQPEAYVMPYPGPGERIRLSSGGARLLQWGRDGKELFYLASDKRLMSLPIRTSPSLQTGTPVELFKLEGKLWANFQLSLDGKRFLAVVPQTSAAEQPWTVVVNWTSGVGR